MAITKYNFCEVVIVLIFMIIGFVFGRCLDES